MQSRSENESEVATSIICTEPAAVGYNATSSVESNDAKSQSTANSGVNRIDDAHKESQVKASSRSEENEGGNPELTHLSSITQPSQLQLIGHSIQACAFPDPYYGGMMESYGHKSLGFAPYDGKPHTRMVLHPEISQEPVYVNAKQYQAILRRRQARAKAELEKKLITSRKPYLHESRHQHAMRRPRGNGGRFAKKTDVEASNGKRNSSTSSSSKLVGEEVEHSLPKSHHDGMQHYVYKTREEGDYSGQPWNYQSSQTRLAIK